MQNPGRMRALRRRLLAFCLLHSWGGPGAVWGWSGGGLTWVEQSSDIKLLTKLAMWLWMRSSAPCMGGAAPVHAWCRPGEAPMWVVQVSGVAALVRRILHSPFPSSVAALRRVDVFCGLSLSSRSFSAGAETLCLVVLPFALQLIKSLPRPWERVSVVS
jgi:hypothetical protein